MHAALMVAVNGGNVVQLGSIFPLPKTRNSQATRHSRSDASSAMRWSVFSTKR